LNSKITIEVAGASKAAIAAVEKAGGSVIVAAPAKAPSGSSTAQGQVEG
jgi:large subunit ribosomal protein L15